MLENLQLKKEDPCQNNKFFLNEWAQTLFDSTQVQNEVRGHID